MFVSDLFFKKKLKYAVIGSGSVGGTIASFLKEADKDITLITKYPHLINSAKRQGGIKLTSSVLGEKIYDVKIIDENQSGNIKADIIFLCIRTPDFPSAYPIIKKISNKNTIVCAISNGFGIGGYLQEQLPTVHIIESAFVGMCRWFDRESPNFLQKREYCEFKFSTRNDQNVDRKLFEIFKQDMSDTKMTGGYISPEAMQSLLFERLITRSPFESCCVLYDITANEITGEREETFIKLCKELLLLAKALKISLPDNILDEYLNNFNEYKKRDDANVVSSILTDIKREQKSESDFFIFEPVRLAKKHGVNMPEYFKIAEKYSHISALINRKETND